MAWAHLSSASEKRLSGIDRSRARTNLANYVGTEQHYSKRQEQACMRALHLLTAEQYMMWVRVAQQYSTAQLHRSSERANVPGFVLFRHSQGL